MKTFKVCWKEEVIYRMDIEANSKEEAEKKFHTGDCDYSCSKEDGGEIIAGSVVIDEVEE